MYIAMNIKCFRNYLHYALSLLLAISPLKAKANCDWKDLLITPENPYTHCSEQSEVYLRKMKHCNPNGTLASEKKLDLLVLREELKLTFAQELLYVSRIAPKSRYFEQVWVNLETKWKKRIASAGELLEIDKSEKLKGERCTLHVYADLLCDQNIPVLQYFQMRKEQVIQGYKNSLLTRRIPEGTLYSLIEAKLIADSSNYLVYNKESLSESDLFKHEKINKSIQTYVYNFYPELHINATLSENLASIIKVRGLVAKVISQAGKKFLTMAQRKKIVDDVMNQSFSQKPLSQNLLDGFEHELLQGMQMIFNRFDFEIRKGLANPAWVMGQDHYILPRLNMAMQLQQPQEAGFLQYQICVNYLSIRESDRKKEMAKIVFSGLALLTGIGALFEVGAILGTTLIISNFAFMGAVSAIDLHTAGKKSNEMMRLYLLREANYTNVAQADKDLVTQIPWAIINVALVTPLIALKYINDARKVAMTTKDSQTLMRLDRMQKGVITVAVVGGGGMAAVGVYDGYQAFKELVEEDVEEAFEK